MRFDRSIARALAEDIRDVASEAGRGSIEATVTAQQLIDNGHAEAAKQAVEFALMLHRMRMMLMVAGRNISRARRSDVPAAVEASLDGVREARSVMREIDRNLTRLRETLFDG